MPTGKDWTEYTTETGLRCGYRWVEDDNDYRIKVFSSMPRSYYHSAVNEAGAYFDEVIRPTLKTH